MKQLVLKDTSRFMRNSNFLFFKHLTEFNMHYEENEKEKKLTFSKAKIIKRMLRNAQRISCH